jgi:ribokinase
MIARVGDDAFGVTLRQNLVADGINVDHILTTPNCSSGVALIGVDVTGANAITVIPAANGRLSVADVEACATTIASARALIVQLETPVETVAAAVRIAKQAGVLTVLDPAPAPVQPLPRELMRVDIFSPNQSEARTLTGIVVEDWRSAEAAARELQSMGASDVVLKMGEWGAFVLSHEGDADQIAAVKAKIVDTTAAGDAFTAAMTLARCQGQSLARSAGYGCLAGTFACTRFGAQPAMPTRSDLETWSQMSSSGQ